MVATTILGAMEELVSCVSEKLCIECDVSLAPGAVPITMPGQDTAWVRLMTAFPSTTFPQQSSQLNNCSASMAYTVEIGVVRCIPVQARQLISRDVLASVTRKNMQDMIDVLAALRCCLEGWDMVVGNWVPLGPQGNVAGGAWQVTIGPEYG